jgi:hypothetical protein
MVEARVAGAQQQVVLQGQSGDPEVVRGNRSALSPQLRIHAGKVMAGGLADEAKSLLQRGKGHTVHALAVFRRPLFDRAPISSLILFGFGLDPSAEKK